MGREVDGPDWWPSAEAFDAEYVARGELLRFEALYRVAVAFDAAFGEHWPGGLGLHYPKLPNECAGTEGKPPRSLVHQVVNQRYAQSLVRAHPPWVPR